MATRSLIGMESKDDKIQYIYCHWDGYVVEGVGQCLLEYFKDRSKVQDLLALGEISSLGGRLTKDADPVDGYNGAEITWAYHRDSGEVLNRREPVKDRDAFIAKAKDIGTDCNYIFDANCEWLYKGTKTDKPFVRVEDFINEYKERKQC